MRFEAERGRALERQPAPARAGEPNRCVTLVEATLEHEQPVVEETRKLEQAVGFEHVWSLGRSVLTAADADAVAARLGLG